MKRPWFIAGLALVLAGIAVVWIQNPKLPAHDAPATSAKPALATEFPSITQPAPSVAETSPGPPQPANPSPAISIPTEPPVPEAPAEQIRTEIENVQMDLRDYRTAFGENPVGSNVEITAALTGKNLKQLRLTIPPGSSVSADGEMCDRWSTPYFFHQLSGKQMEIHSAGPDRIMGTGDDVIVK